MLEVLNDPLVKAISALVVVPVVVLLLLLGTILLLRTILMPPREVLEVERLRLERFEAGNPPKREPGRGKVSMQYLGYLIIFLAVEPALVLFALTLAAPGTLAVNLLKLYVIMIAVYAPLLYYALREAKDYRNWVVD
ncbi:MAG: hypothetical protein F7B95_04350 [Desulfurococcales archaeon]|nr:hypothetical protein [Desulfurococcales archaeon]